MKYRKTVACTALLCHAIVGFASHHDTAREHRRTAAIATSSDSTSAASTTVISNPDAGAMNALTPSSPNTPLIAPLDLRQSSAPIKIESNSNGFSGGSLGMATNIGIPSAEGNITGMVSATTPTSNTLAAPGTPQAAGIMGKDLIYSGNLNQFFNDNNLATPAAKQVMDSMRLAYNVNVGHGLPCTGADEFLALLNRDNTAKSSFISIVNSNDSEKINLLIYLCKVLLHQNVHQGMAEKIAHLLPIIAHHSNSKMSKLLQLDPGRFVALYIPSQA